MQAPAGNHEASTVAPETTPRGATVEGATVAAAAMATGTAQGDALWLWLGQTPTNRIIRIRRKGSVLPDVEKWFMHKTK